MQGAARPASLPGLDRRRAGAHLPLGERVISRLKPLLLCAVLAQAGWGCGSQATPPAPLERVSVQRGADGAFTTLLRGASADHFDGPRDVADAGDGHAVVVGGTESPDFPTTEDAHQPRFSTGGTRLGSFPEMDVFVTKLRPDGSILWSTFLGGPNYDRAYAVEVDADGNVFVAGRAGDGFPTTPGSLQEAFAGDADPNGAYGPQDGFVAKFDADGALLWSTYLGDGSFTFVRDIDIDRDGNVYAALRGRGAFPHVTSRAQQPRPGGGNDNVLVKLAADGSRVVWATYLGREEDEGEPTVRLDPDGRIFVLTNTWSDGWVADGKGFQDERKGKGDLLLVRFSNDGVLEASTYLGGSDDDATETNHLALDGRGRPVVAFATVSTDLPIPRADAFRDRHGPSRHDGYVARISADLDALIAATYIGHAGKGGGCEGVAVGPDGSVYVGGATGGGLPTTPDAVQRAFGGERDAYLARLSPDLSRALHLTFWGGPGHDNQRALRLDAKGHVLSVGQTDGDVFVVRFVLPP